ncbi:MAG: hypothetical protein M1827_005764 [Pycnora praestabilis]|nr:MAG: hypothetical protein M1827_005764 [Pycnora praestabilis]
MEPVGDYEKRSGRASGNLSATTPAVSSGVGSSSEQKRKYTGILDFREAKRNRGSKVRPERQGKLNEATLENMRDVKAKGGACWFCKIYRKSCDTGNPCKQCPTGTGKGKWKMGCRRESLEKCADNFVPGK